MNLAEKQKKEKESLKRLADRISNEISDISELVKFLEAYKEWQGIDPLPHLKAAMLSYTEGL